MKKQSYLFLIGGMFSLIIAMGIGRFAYTPILPLMQNDISFSNTVAGYLASSNYAGYLAGAIITGIIPLKKYRTVTLRMSLIVSILTTALMGLTNSIFLWYVIRFLSGVASAFVFVTASSIVLDKLASENKSNWSGVLYGGVGSGIFISSLFIPGLSDLFQWEGAWGGLSVISGILTYLVWIWIKDSQAEVPIKNKQEIIVQVPPAKWLPWLSIAYGLEGMGYIITGTFIVSIAEKASSFHNDATVVWMVVGLAAIPSCIIWSILAKRWGYVKSLVLALILQSIGIVIPVFWMSQISFFTSALLFGATFMGITTLTTTLARQMKPADSSRLIGKLTIIYAAGQMIGPTMAGILSSYTHDYTVALLGAAGAVLVGGVSILNGIQFERKPKLESSAIHEFINEKR